MKSELRDREGNTGVKTLALQVSNPGVITDIAYGPAEPYKE